MKIAILDPVGIKAGMDYYDTFLLTALERVSVETYLFSNFTPKHTVISTYQFFAITKYRKLNKLIKYALAVLKSLWTCKRKKVKHVILHIFHGSNPDLILSLLTKLFGFKTILIIHDQESFISTDRPWRRRFLYNHLADILIVHNQYGKKQIRSELTSASAKKLRVIKHGNYIDLPVSKISKEKARNKLKLPKKPFYILFFGQIKKTKGLEILLNALPHMNKQINLIIAGKPRRQTFRHYENIISKLTLENRVSKIIRHIDESERALLFSIAEALILPYRKMSQSGVLLMGMSCQVPIIASDLEPAKEIIVSNQNGLLFDAGDSRALAKKVNLLYKDSKLRMKLKRNGLATVKKLYSWDSIAKDYIKILRDYENRDPRYERNS